MKKFRKRKRLINMDMTNKLIGLYKEDEQFRKAFIELSKVGYTIGDIRLKEDNDFVKIVGGIRK